MDLEVKKFYQHSTYQNVYNASRIRIEQFLAKTFFGQDLSRILFASNEYAFRARSEQNVVDGNLNLPFMNYYANDWAVDPLRERSILAYNGVALTGIDFPVKAYPVVWSYEGALFHSRTDDSTFSYTRALLDLKIRKKWLSFPMRIAGQDQLIYLNIVDVEPSFNPELREKDWLERQKIVSIPLTFKVETLILDFMEAEVESAVPDTVIAEFWAGKGGNPDELATVMAIQDPIARVERVMDAVSPGYTPKELPVAETPPPAVAKKSRKRKADVQVEPTGEPEVAPEVADPPMAPEVVSPPSPAVVAPAGVSASPGPRRGSREDIQAIVQGLKSKKS